MRAFLTTVGILSWLMALAVLVIFAQSGGVLTVIAAGVFAVTAMVALGCERIIRTLEQIRDGRIPVEHVADGKLSVLSGPPALSN